MQPTKQGAGECLSPSLSTTLERTSSRDALLHNCEAEMAKLVRCAVSRVRASSFCVSSAFPRWISGLFLCQKKKGHKQRNDMRRLWEKKRKKRVLHRCASMIAFVRIVSSPRFHPVTGPVQQLGPSAVSSEVYDALNPLRRQ